MLSAKPVKEEVVHGRRMRYLRTGPLRIVQNAMVLQQSPKEVSAEWYRKNEERARKEFESVMRYFNEDEW